jgi:hypothetical protein
MEKLIKLVTFRIYNFHDFIITDEQITQALELSLSAFNLQAPVTNIKITDTENLDQLSDILVSYACYILLFRQTLIEKTKEENEKSKNSDQPVYSGYALSTMLESMTQQEFSNWLNKVDRIKDDESFVKEFVTE